MRTFAALVVLALVVRLAVVAATTGYTPVNDPADYDRHAESIARHLAYPPSIYVYGPARPAGASAFRPPGYPVALAAVYELAGRRWTVARAIQSFGGALVAALIGLLGRQLWDRRVGLVALGLAAVYPPLVLPSAALLSENLFVPLILAALVLLLRHRDRRACLRLPALIGLLMGMAILTRPVGALLLAPVAVGLWTERPWRTRAAAAAPALAVGIALLCVAPWVVRNAIVLDEPVLATEGSYLIAGTYNQTSQHDPIAPAAWKPPNLLPAYRDLLERPGLDEATYERLIRNRGLRYIRRHPFSVLRTGYWNATRLLDLSGGHALSRQVYTDVGQGTRLADSAIYGFFAVGLLALAGAFTAAARRAPRWLWSVPVLLAVGVVFVSGFSRYRVPIEPFFVLLAALGLVALWDRARSSGARSQMTGSVSACVRGRD